MKIIFLDFDGVIKTDYSSDEDKGIKGGRDWVQPELVSHLNKIIEATGANVVVSSVWRKLYSVCELREILNKAGFKGKVIGKTGNDPSGIRGREIQEWLDTCPRKSVEQFVIIDDSSDMEHLMDKLVKTYTYEGLTEKHIGLAVEMLNEGIDVD